MAGSTDKDPKDTPNRAFNKGEIAISPYCLPFLQ
jgi:hypothetical protein